MTMSRILKPFLLLLASLALLILFALVLPFLIDLNHLKPQIQTAVSDNVNAKIEFSSLRLRVFPSVGFVLKDVSVVNTGAPFENIELFAVDEVDFDIKLLPLFSRKFIGNIVIDEPNVRFAKTVASNNFSVLLKDSAKTAKEDAGEGESSGSALGDVKESIVIESFRIENAKLQILEELGASFEPTSSITDLNLLVTDIGFDRDIKIELATDVATRSQGIDIHGPVIARIISKVTTSGNEVSLIDFDGLISLDQLAINVQDALVKTNEIPLHIKFKGSSSLKNLTLEQASLVFHNLRADGRIKVDNFETLPIQGSMELINDDISALATVLPKHRDLLMNGRIHLKASLAGLLSQYQQVKANVDLKAILNGSDFSLISSLTSIKPLKVQTKLASKTLDLDQLLKPFLPTNPAAEKVAETPTANTEKTSDKDKTTEPTEFALNDELKPFFAGSNSNVFVEFGEIIYSKNSIRNFSMSLSLKDFLGSLDHLKFNGFEGSMASNGRVYLGATPVKYDGNLNLKSIAIEALATSFAPQFSETVKGMLNLNLEISSIGTTWEVISDSLNGKGDFLLQKGQLSTVNVAEAMETRVNEFVKESSVVQAADDVFADAEKLLQNPLLKKVPQGSKIDLDKYRKSYASFREVELSGMLNRDKELSDVKGKLQIKDGRIYITSLDQTGGGQFSFSGSVGFDTTLRGESIFLASPQTQQKLQQQSRYASLLNNQSGNLEIPAILSGTVKSPQIKVDTTKLKEHFVKNAKELVAREVKSQIEKQMSDGVDAAKKKLQEAADKKREEAKRQAKKKVEKQLDERLKDDKTKDKIKEKLKGIW